ncbi:hypothetical protein [Massiliimalia massiliensis]|uniref:hypothetical protein n=1 Tax=Massiliimalia massiliensis TaxID=1852384 RepID=UPI00098470BD|nr:hypothetical protein [Massiliimalia massiliensis]
MNRIKEIKKQLEDRYCYDRKLKEKDVQRLRRNIPSDFSETVAASLIVGCLRLDAVLYRSDDTLRFGYDVFVKDDPALPEWICYDTLPEPVSLKEADMLSVLDRFADQCGLSFTESCFSRLDGKVIKKEKPSL